MHFPSPRFRRVAIGVAVASFLPFVVNKQPTECAPKRAFKPTTLEEAKAAGFRTSFPFQPMANPVEFWLFETAGGKILTPFAKMQIREGAAYSRSQIQKQRFELKLAGVKPNKSLAKKDYDLPALVDFFKIPSRTIIRAVNEPSKPPKVKKRIGRPVVMTQEVKEKICAINNERGGTSSANIQGILRNDLSFEYAPQVNKVTGETEFGTMYKGICTPGPSASSINLAKKTLIKKKVRVRPALSVANEEQREEWCAKNFLGDPMKMVGNERIEFFANLSRRIDVDELNLVLTVGTGNMLFP